MLFSFWREQMFLCVYVFTSKSFYINLWVLAAGRHLLINNLKAIYKNFKLIVLSKT